MRIISGAFRGRQIKAPHGSGTRPTTDRVRESIFNLLASRLEFREARVLDLFCGSGALGFESISRGAESVVFVDNAAAAVAMARANADALGVMRQCRFVRADVVDFLKRNASGDRFDIVFADPPYELESLAELPELALPLLDERGLFVLEHDARIHFDDHPHLDTSRAYGRTIVTIFDALPQDEQDSL